MKREEKNALSRQRILAAAMEEFSLKGYEGASLNTICAKNDISKGIIYHYFKDRDELYLVCATECFDAATSYLQTVAATLVGSAEEKLRTYFDARLRFFAENTLYLGVFASAVLNPPVALRSEIGACRQEFDDLNISVLTDLLNGEHLRKGMSAAGIAEDFRVYMDFFNMRVQAVFSDKDSIKNMLHEHEERCHRQLDILLHGVLDDNHEK